MSDETRTTEKAPSRRLAVALLAHVDAGKTTLSEAMLFEAGSLRRRGRVDHGDSFLDGENLERERGITIFSKQARLTWGDAEITLLDTPGHVDFAAETERALRVPDLAVLIISGGEGIQSHTETLWKLLRRYEIPTFLFVNKMDLAMKDRDEILERLQRRLGAGVVDMQLPAEERNDALTLASETLTERFLEEGELTDEAVRAAVRRREVFPCYFGVALDGSGVAGLLDGIARYGQGVPTGKEAATGREAADLAARPFGARVFKIAHDAGGERLTFVRITSGTLRVREDVSLGSGGGAGKVNQIRLYSGPKYEAVQEAGPGEICALTGLAKTRPGMGLGIEPDGGEEVLEPFLSYRVLLPEGKDVRTVYEDLSRLAEEDPKLSVELLPGTGEIHVRLMGPVQREVLEKLAEERFGYPLAFDSGRIMYRETVTKPVEGVGHFEPLRHYAEVHLLMEPGERGSGLVFDTSVSEDDLDRNWQRLILTHLYEKEYRGVLTNSPITDMKITLAAGRAHQKHTEGGDFRQATYRAVRQGLMEAAFGAGPGNGSVVLLEPWFTYRLEVPAEQIGRAMTDIRRMDGTFEGPDQQEDGTAVLTGRAPVAGMKDYALEVMNYTGGRGRLACRLDGYDICKDQAAVIEAIGYDPLRDVDDPADSVFVSHSGSDIVPWDQVKSHMHLSSVLGKGSDEGGPTTGSAQTENKGSGSGRGAGNSAGSGSSASSGDDDLKYFEQVYGKIRRNPLTMPGKNRREQSQATLERLRELRQADDRASDLTKDGAAGQGGERTASGPASRKRRKEIPTGPLHVIIDGYNLLHDREDWADLMKGDPDPARERLVTLLANYAAYTGHRVTVVFDAYKRQGAAGSREDLHGVEVVYTKEEETADVYIEKLTAELGKKEPLRVVSSDALIQTLTFGHGALRVPSREFWLELEAVMEEIRDALEP